MLNIVSLILGLCAWIFAVLGISASKASAVHRNTFVSVTSCAISLLVQLFEINRRLLLSDLAAIEDTIRAVLTASVVLVSITIILDLIAIIKIRNLPVDRNIIHSENAGFP